MATLDDKDYTANNSSSSYVDTSFNNSNPLTKNIESLVDSYIHMNNQIDNHIYTNISADAYDEWKANGFPKVPFDKKNATFIHQPGQKEYPGLVVESTPGNVTQYYRVIITSVEPLSYIHHLTFSALHQNVWGTNSSHPL